MFGYFSRILGNAERNYDVVKERDWHSWRT